MTPARLAEDRQTVDGLPFDGYAVSLPGLTNSLLDATPVPASAFRDALRPMPVLKRATHNFLVVRMLADHYDFDDAGRWQTMAANLQGLAQAARTRPDFDGIFLDTEYYGDGHFPWNGSTSDRAQWDRVAQRGRQLATAVAAVWPGSVLLTTYGPWVGSSSSADRGFVGLRYNDVAHANLLMGAFVAGIADGCRRSGLHYVDGGEIYQLRTPDDFEQAYQWMRFGLAETDPEALSGGGAARYPETTSVAFGVYDAEVSHQGYPPLDAAVFEHALASALRRADRYVWTYSDRFDWLQEPGRDRAPPRDLVRALDAALSTARG